MGEIGISRREFLYELKWWEIKSIIRGYNARHHAGWEQARLIAYNAHYAMGLPKGQTAPTVDKWIKFAWETSDETPDDIPDDETIEEIRRDIIESNKQLEKAKGL